MPSIVFKTPGLLDLRALTTFGLHAKPNSDSPIGKFGTGLKYAIAVLLREGCKVRVLIGLHEYVFFTTNTDFRGVEFLQVKLRKRKDFLSRWRYESLPFTTEHGKFWQVWQAFRELESNTRDEAGETFVSNIPAKPLADHTIIEVTGDKFYEAYQNRDTIFLPSSLTPRDSSSSVQVFNEPSKHLYWRGIRVYDLEKPSTYTYNILKDLELTEDRTLKSMFHATMCIGEHVARSNDEHLINTVVSAKPEQFEHSIDFTYTYVLPSQTFNDIMAKKARRGSYYRPSAYELYEKYTTKPALPETLSIMDELQYHYNTCDFGKPRLKKFLARLLKCKIEEPDTSDEDTDIPF